MSPPRNSQTKSEFSLRGLERVPTKRVRQNPNNPRIHFTEEEMERLTESISEEGILVPVVVYPEGQHYVLIDGERRWRAATTLGMAEIPAVIADPPDARENLLLMFNIHMVREPWADMPTAWALEKVITETGMEDERDLSDITGLSIERLKRLRHALELPKEYQKYINEGTIPLNFFWELKRNVIDPLARQRPSLWNELGDETVLNAFVTKRLKGIVTDVVSLRKVRPIISLAANEVEDIAEPSPLDATIRDLILSEDTTIDEAYEDSVEMIVEADKFERKMKNILKGLERLLSRAKTRQEKASLRRLGSRFAKALTELVK